MSGIGSRAVLALLAISLLGYAAWEAACWGIADIYSLRARDEVAVWSYKRQAPSFERWSRDIDALRSAMRLTPDDATLHETLGLGYALAATTFGAGGNAGVYREFALVHFRRAASLRPTSPFPLMSVALMLYRLGRVNDELYDALSRSMRLGPWEPDLQLLASELGIALWNELPPELRVEMRQMWHRAAHRQSEELAKIAIALQRQDLLCAESIASLRKPLNCDRPPKGRAPSRTK